MGPMWDWRPEQTWSLTSINLPLIPKPTERNMSRNVNKFMFFFERWQQQLILSINAPLTKLSKLDITDVVKAYINKFNI